MVQTRAAGADIDGRRLLGTQRVLGTQYTEFFIGGVKFEQTGKKWANKSIITQDKASKRMSMLYVLVPLALLLLGIAVWAMLWAIKSGQFDDLESHGWSVVLDDDQKPPPLDADELADETTRE